MEPFYRKIYGQTWQLIKQNLHLLFFGLFASLLGFSEIKMILNWQDGTPDLISNGLANVWLYLKIVMVNGINLQNLNPFIAAIGLFILFGIILVLSICSQGALMYSAAEKNKASQGKKKINGALQVALDRFWSLLGLSIVNSLIGYFFISLVIKPLVDIAALNTALPYYFLMTIIIFFLLIPMVIMISFATRYGVGYVMIYKQPFKTAFNNGWELFRINWLITVESAITIMLTTLLYFAIMFALIAIVFAPFLILAYLLAVNLAIFKIFILLGAIISILLLILGTAFYGAYYNLLWSYVFLRLTSRTPSYSKIHRFTHKHLPSLTR